MDYPGTWWEEAAPEGVPGIIIVIMTDTRSSCGPTRGDHNEREDSEQGRESWRLDN